MASEKAILEALTRMARVLGEKRRKALGYGGEAEAQAEHEKAGVPAAFWPEFLEGWNKAAAEEGGASAGA